MLEVFLEKIYFKKIEIWQRLYCLLEFLPFIVNTAVLKTATYIGGKSVCQAENNVTSNSPIKTFTSVVSSIYDWLLVATRYWRPIRNALVVQTMPRTLSAGSWFPGHRLKWSKWWTRKAIKIVSYFCFINRRSKNTWFLQRSKKCKI